MEKGFIYGFWYTTSKENYFFTGRRHYKKADIFFREKKLKYSYVGSVSLKKEHFEKVELGIFKVL
ncbi:MAG: hypothetical protein ACM3Q2_17965 [Syntrophothermus sp.]